MNLHKQYFIHVFNRLTKNIIIKDNNIDWSRQIYYFDDDKLLMFYDIKDKILHVSESNFISKFNILYNKPYTTSDISNIIKFLFESKYELRVNKTSSINPEYSILIKDYFLNVIDIK